MISFTFNLPTSVVFVTNYGIFIFQYPVDLTDEIAIAKDVRNNLTPKSVRHIFMNFDNYGDNIVQNVYGNAFMVNRRINMQ